MTLQVFAVLTLNVVIPNLATTTDQLTGQGGTANPVTTTGGLAPFSWTINTALPSGTALTPSTGAIVGSLSGAAVGAVFATSNFTLTVADSNSPVQTASASFSYTINSPLVLAVARPATTITDAAVNFTPVTSAGGTAPGLFTLVSGSANPTAFPAGLTFNTSTAKTFTITQADGSYGTKATVGSTNSTITASGGTLTAAFAMTRQIVN